MTLLEELQIFLKNILHWIYTFVGFSVFFFFFGPKEVTIYGAKYFIPMPIENSFAVEIFNIVRRDLLPSGVDLIVTNPMSAFVAQISFSMLLGFLITIPYFIFKIILYLHPALLPHEKKVVMWALIPFSILFLSGCAFSYFFLIPATFKILYPYASTLGAVTFFTLDDFVSYVLSLMVAVGTMFLLPLFMISLSIIGIVKPVFWKKVWKHALLAFLLLSAIITPDGTGITMAMLFLPLMGLYFLGYVFAKRLG